MKGLRRRHGHGRKRYGRAVMQSITTKYLGATNSRGSRIKATSASGQSVTVPYDHGLDTNEMHHKAAKALAKKLGWDKPMIAGSLGNSGNVYVFRDGSDVIDPAK